MPKIPNPGTEELKAATPLQDKPTPCSNGTQNISNIFTLDLNWASKFVIPWEHCSQELKKACEDKKIPPKRELLTFNKMLCDTVYSVKKKPGKKALEIIAKKVCSKYPHTFKDNIPGFGAVGDGSGTVLKRLINYIDGKNRTGANSLRRVLYSKTDETPENGTKRKSSSVYLKDSYGCVNWQPDTLPLGETEKSQEESRVWLCNEYSLDYQDNVKCEKLWKDTFVTQRLTINKAGKHLQELVRNWPYFKKPEMLFTHFEILMDFNLMDRFDEQYSSKCEELLNFALEMGNKNARSAASNLRSLVEQVGSKMPVLSGLVWIIPFLMDENQDVLFKKDEVLLILGDCILILICSYSVANICCHINFTDC